MTKNENSMGLNYSVIPTINQKSSCAAGSGIMTDKDISHVARVIALYRARAYGWLEGRSMSEMGRTLDVNRSTIMRNLRDLDEVERLAQEYLDKLAPHVRTK